MPRLVLRNATVLDADGARPRSTVVVEERRIVTVRTGAGTGTDADAVEAWAEDRVVDSLDARSCRAW